MLRAHRSVLLLLSLSHLSHGFSRRVAETLIDRAIEVNAVGGVYGNNKPTEFMCLLLKLLQIQPEKEILIEYLQAEEFKCVFFLTIFSFELMKLNLSSLFGLEDT